MNVGAVDALSKEQSTEAPSKEQSAEAPKQKTEVRAWPVLAPEALHGLAGEVVRTIEPHTESDPVAILVQFLVSFGSVIGRLPYFKMEGDRHFANLYAVLVGKSSKSRKGTSAGRVREIMKGVDQEWAEKCIQSGLSSGEGLIWQIRDDVHGVNKKGEATIEKGVQDKRLLLDEREFSQALTVTKREGNTVSRMVRDAWDGRPLACLTKTAKGECRKPHVSIVAHITCDELRVLLDLTSMANGFANRFLFVCVRRSKELPHGGNLSAAAVDALSKKIYKVASPFIALSNENMSATSKDPEVQVRVERFKAFGRENGGREILITMNAEAHTLWESEYHDLSSDRSGMLGAICGRAEAQTLRLALVYALLDGMAEIEAVHLRAALAVWKYCEDSARYIFGDSVGSGFANELLRMLRENNGLSRTQISNVFARHQKHEVISAALDTLHDHGLVKKEMRSGKGRSVEFWAPIPSA